MNFLKKAFAVVLALAFITTTLSAQNKQTFTKHEGWSTLYYYYLKNKPADVLNTYYYKAATSQKIVAITFDDGFVPNTQAIINYLQKNNIPATFFILMGRKNTTAEQMKRYASSLFEIGMHGFRHDDYRKISPEKIETDINLCVKRAANISSNKKIKYFRPPYGVVDSYATKLLTKNHLQGVLWSTDSRDWAGFKKQKLVDNVMKDLGSGSIVLMHDHINITDLDMLCKEITRQGYQIVPLSKLMRYKADQPK